MPVKATTSPEDAPVLTPGQYTDSFTMGDAKRYYKVKRGAGTTVNFSVTARPPANPEDYSTERLDIDATLPDGTGCGDNNALRFDPGQRTEAVVSAMRIRGPKSAEDTKVCATATELIVSVDRPQGVAGAVRVEVLFVEEPTVNDTTTLPAKLDPATVKPLIAPASGPGTPVVGGGGFSDALTLGPGTYTEVVLPGEQIFYRVRGDFGQRLAFTVDAPTPGQKVELGSTSYTGFAVDAYTPWRYPINRSGGAPSNSDSIGPSGKPVLLGEYTPEIRYLNRDSYGNGSYSWVHLSQVSGAGYYYFALGRTAEKAGEDSAVPVTVRLRVAVEGTPTGEPAYAGAASDDPASPSVSGEPTASPTKDDTVEPVSRENDPSPFAWIFGGLVAVLGLGAAAAGLLRRKGSGRPDDPLVADDDHLGGGSQA